MVSTVDDNSERLGGRHGPSAAQVVFFGNEFPSDDLKTLFRRLCQHSRDRRFRTLNAFLDVAAQTLKDEVAKLPQPARGAVPPFDSVLSLVEHGDFHPGPLGAAMESATLVAFQLSMLIGHYEAQDTEFDLIRNNVVLAGLSIGLLTGAAVALSESLADLVKNGAEALRVGFRLGVYVDDFSRKLESPQPDGTPSSWAHVVTDMSKEAVETEVERYNAEHGGPLLTQVFLSAADKNSVSITGPPSRLKAVFHHSHALRYSKSLPLPVYDGVCHAPHIYSDGDIKTFIDSASSVIPPERLVRLPLLSSHTGRPYAATTADELFHMIGAELLTRTIYLDHITTGIVDHFAGAPGSSPGHFGTFRTSLVVRGIEAAIENRSPKVARQDFVEWSSEDYGSRRPRTAADSKLAIIGMACRMPGGGNDPDQFWDLLEQGRDVHVKVPADRFDLATHFDPTGNTENATTTEFGNFIDRPGYFDAGFFRMSPKEAEQTDPMQRLALVTAYEALEMAGVVPGRTPSTQPSRIGTWYGQASDDWRELNASQNVGTYAVPGGVRGFTTGRINYFFGFSGPSFCIDTACSSSMAAVHAACTALWAGEADTAIAGGVNVITDPDNYAGLCNAHFLSKTGQCQVWDVNADGYCRAEGIGSIVIKRLEDAEADNDNILATVLSAATNHSADAISITHPHAGAQRDNYRSVLTRAGVNPLDVGYVEMHGTGTQAGDAVESESILDVFAPLSPRRRPDQRLHLGAVKANIGHGEAAAGISALIKALLVFQNDKIPPHIGIKNAINPAIPKDLDKRNAGLAIQTTPWVRPQGKCRLALVNSFGAHGGNTTLLLEDGPLMDRHRRPPGGTDACAAYTITVSAKSKRSLQANVENLLAYVNDHAGIDVADLSYTTCARRMHHNLRVATTVSSIPALQKFLRSLLDTKTIADVKPIPADAPSTILTFTGQGATYSGIDGALYKAFPGFRDQVHQLDGIVQRLGFPTIVPILDGSVDDEVASPVTSQLSIVVLEIALARLWSSFGVRPSAVIGHSLGEYSMLAVAGVLSAADALYLVGRRAQLTEQLCTAGSHAMLSVRASAAEIDQVVREDVAAVGLKYELSCNNTHQDTVLGGLKDHIDVIRQALERKSHKCVALNLPFAFHTAQMDPVLAEFEKLASRIPFKAPSIPILSTLVGGAVFDGKTIDAAYLRRQMRGTVDFVAAIEAAQNLGMINSKTCWVDLGPHPVCIGFVRALFPQATTLSSCRRNEDNLTTLAKSLATLHVAGLTPDWAEYFRPHERLHTMLNIPKYSWNETNYWIPYIGTWTLDKALLKHGGEFLATKRPQQALPPSTPALRTSTIHHVSSEGFTPTSATMSVMSDIQHPDFLGAVHGHKMNNCGVATSSIWSDMAYSVGEYLYLRLKPSAQVAFMNLCDFRVLHAQVAKKKRNSTQPLALEAHLDLDTQSMSLAWFDFIEATGERSQESFATGTVRFEDPIAWRAEWDRMTHLVQGRIEALEQMSAAGNASRLSRGMAYALFKNVVDYADQYRGMGSVVINDYEAMADITLSTELHGNWHTPPHWIDSVSHLAGLILNGSDASNTRDFFYVTPGFDSFRLARPLEAGGKYQNYVRMFPHHAEPNMYAGDLFILQNGAIIGALGQIKFRRVPRLLMDRFFSPPDNGMASTEQGLAPNLASDALQSHSVAVPTNARRSPTRITTYLNTSNGVAPPIPQSEVSTASSASRSMPPITTPSDSSETRSNTDSASGPSAQCMQLIARETNLAMSDLTADAEFSQLGVDSLMSLVLSEKFRSELGLEVKSSLFLECPTIGELQAWVEQNC